jgi:hypothetical protein
MNIKLLSFFALLLLGSCCTAPEIIPSVSQDSVIMMSLKEQIKDNNKIETGWGWIAWYLPVVFLVGAWTWRELIKKPFVCETCEFERTKAANAFRKLKSNEEKAKAESAKADKDSDEKKDQEKSETTQTSSITN